MPEFSESPESTKDRIINASIDLFSINGYFETSIRDIAKYVGIKTSSIYYHFESKEAILNNILDLYMRVVSENEIKNKWNEDRMTRKSDISVQNIMNYLFFKFDEPNIDRNRKIVKILCNEAFRNIKVRDYFGRQKNYSFSYIRSVLDSLIETGKIPKCNTDKLAGVLYSITFAFMYLDSIDMQHIGEDNGGTDMFSLLEYVLRMVVEGSYE